MTANWFNGSTNVAWPAVAGGDDDAVFGGAAGLVDVSATGVSVNDLGFNTSGYTLQGGQVTLGGTATPALSAASAVTATVSSSLGGTTGFNKINPGTVVLAGDNNFTGNVTVSAGTLRLAHANALGTVAKSVVMQGNSRVLQLSNNILLGSHLSFTAATNSGDGMGISNFDGENEIAGEVNYSFGNPALNISSLAGKLTISGNITLVTSTRTLYLGGPSTQDNTVSGVIGQNSATNVLPVVKQGSGRWVLSGANTYTGNTTVNAGTLAVTGGLYSSATADYSASTVTINNGAILELANWWRDASGSLALLPLDAARVVINGGTLRVTGETGSGRAFTVNSGGATLEAAAGADWMLHAFGGTPAIVYSGDPNLTLTGAGNGSFFKNFSGAGSLIKRGTGMWTIGENTSHTGDTIVEQGVLRMRHPNLSDTAAVRISRGAMLDLWHYDGDAVDALVLDGVSMPAGTYDKSTHPQYFTGRGSLVVGGPAVAGARPLAYWLNNTSRSDIISSMEGCMNYFNKYGRFSGNIEVRYDSNVPTANASQGGPITFGGSISSRTAMHEMCHVQGTGTAWQWDYNRSGGQWTGQAVNRLVRQFNSSTSAMGCDGTHFWPYGLNYPNEDGEDVRRIQPMIVEAFRKDMGIGWSPPSIGSIPDQSVATNMSTGAVSFTTSSDATALTASSSNTVLVPVSNITISGSGTGRSITVTPASNQTGSTTIHVIATDGLDTVSTTFTVTVGGATSAYVWTNGTGSWDAVTPNWTGAGTLWPNSGSDHAVITGSAATLTVASGISAGAVTFNTNATLQGSPLTLAGSSPVVHVQDGVTVQAGAQLAGSSGFNKGGLGTLVLSGGQIYLGATTIAAGTLQLGNGTTAGTLAGTISNTGNLTWNPPADLTFTNVITGAGGVTQSSPHTITLSAANTYTGPTTLTAGTLVILGGHASSQHTIAAGTVLRFDTTSGTLNHGSTTFTGSGTLVKAGSNNLVWGAGAATFVLSSGSLIDVQAGTFVGGSNANENWSSNQSDLNLAAGATFDGVEANVRINRLSGSGTLKTGYNGGGYSNFTIGVANGSSTFDGTIANSLSAGSISKIGSGTITFSNANSYTGTTSISGSSGILRISHGSALGSSAGGVGITGGTSSAALELSGGITVSGESITMDGRSTGSAHLRNHSGNNTWTGTISTNVGGSFYNLESASGTLTIAGALTNNQSGTRFWQLRGSGDGIVSGVIGAGSNPSGATVYKYGSGTWKLTAANLYGGPTGLYEGKLILAGSLQSSLVSTSAAATLGVEGSASTSGGLQQDAGSTLEVSLATTGSSQLAVSGTLALDGALALSASQGLTSGFSRAILVNNGGSPVSGIFVGLPQRTLFNAAGYPWIIDYAGGDGNDVTLTIADAQQQWRFASFGTVDPVGNAADEADPDGDGFTNLEEFLAGTDPDSADSFPAPQVTITSPTAAEVSVVNPSALLKLSAVADAGNVPGPFAFAWSLVSGPGSAVFSDPSSSNNQVRFTAPGDYVLRCSVTAGVQPNTSTGFADLLVHAGTGAMTLTFREGENGYSHTGTIIRSDNPTWNSGSRDQLLVGKTTTPFRSLLSFDLSQLPVNAAVTEATLDLWTATSAGSGSMQEVQLRSLSDTPVEGNGDGTTAASDNGSGATWLSRTGGTSPSDLWVSPGADFSSTVLSTVPGYAATVTSTPKSFPSSEPFVMAVEAARTAAAPVDLVVLSPATEAGANNQFTRIASDNAASVALRPRLSVSYLPQALPNVLTGTPPQPTEGIASPLAGRVAVATSCLWESVSGPGSVSFADASQAATTATFSAPGSYVLRLTAANALGETSATLQVQVNAVPSASGDSVMLSASTSHDINLPMSDPDLDTLSVTSFTQAAFGTVVVNGNVATYTPAATFTGPDAFSYTVSDGKGGEATGAISITVVDTTAPDISTSGDLTAEATGPAGAVVNFTVMASDLVSGAVTPVCAPASGSTFPLGTTIVSVSASDAAGNISNTSFTVTVVDTTAPVITVPPDLTIEATSASCAVATFTTTATDLVSGSVATTNTPASGSVFPLGTTTVTTSASDTGGNVANQTFTVTVVDTTAPVITVPADLTIEATSSSGAVATFTTSATDLVSGGVTTSNTPGSGSVFPVGTTTVTTSASDAAGNTANRTFTVTVNSWNSAPVLAAVGNQTIGQGQALAFTVSATDVDVPAQTLTYSLDAGAPVGATIDPATGAFSWTILASETTGDYTVTVRVTDNGSPAKDDFETITITVTGSLPVPWLTTDLGNVGLAGTAVYDNGTYTLQGAGTGITGTADACRFVYQTASGDCDVIVRVSSLNNTGTEAKAGVMIRESLNANARTAGVWVTPSSGIQFTRRTSTGGTTSVTSSTGKTAPYWVRLTRSGSTFKAYMSTNGSTWNQLGKNTNISMASTTYIGIATTSGTTATLCTGVVTDETTVP